MTAPRRRYFRFWRNIPAEVDDELRFHLESRVRDYVATGVDETRARELALARFGDVERVREHCESIDHQLDQDRRRATMWESIVQDARYAVRALLRNPAFTIVAVFTLALGIGANTAIFSVVNGVLLRPLPYNEPDRLVRLFTAFRGTGEERYSMSQPEFMDYKGQSHLFTNAAAYSGAGLTLTGDGEPERVRGVSATRDLLPVLGITPLRGRNFQDDEGRQGTEPVVIVSHAYWQNRFGGDETLLGRVLTFNGINRRVIGILPPAATFARADAFIPTYINPDSMSARTSNFLSGVARLAPGVTVEQSHRELNMLTKRSVELYPNAYPSTMGYGATVISMHEEIVGDIKPALVILLGAVGLVLLIACANVANLLLARGEARQREVAMRLAIGAPRRRIVRQLLTESTLLALLGAAAGVVFAWWGMRTILAISPDSIPRLGDIRIDMTVGLVTLGVALLTGVLFGLAPALQLTRPDLQSTLKEGTRGGSERRHNLLGRALVVGEVALAVVVVIGAALLVRSFSALRSVSPGFEPGQMLVVDMSIPASRYNAAATTDFYRQLLERMRAVPGVTAVSAASEIPPVSGGNNWDISVEGTTLPPDATAPSPNIRFVTHDYITMMGIRLAQGRTFGNEDHATTTPVALVNETAAKAVWGTENPVGKRVRFSQQQPWMTIIGVIRDVRSAGFEQPIPAELYLLHEQLPAVTRGSARTMFLLLRTTNDPMLHATTARNVIREMDPLLAITNIQSIERVISDSVARPRFTMTLLTVFGGVALTLAAVGIYGIISYGVRRRTREIGIRMALGAQPRDVLRLVVRQGMTLALTGLAIGIVAAFAATQGMRRLLFGVSPTDPISYLAIAAILASVAFLASWIPARRAVRTDPSSALRVD